MIREWVLSAGLHNTNKKNHFISELGLNHPSPTQPVWPEWPVYPGLCPRNLPLVSTRAELNIQDVTLCREVPGLLAFDTWADNNLGALPRPETCRGAGAHNAVSATYWCGKEGRKCQQLGGECGGGGTDPPQSEMSSRNLDSPSNAQLLLKWTTLIHHFQAINCIYSLLSCSLNQHHCLTCFSLPELPLKIPPSKVLHSPPTNLCSFLALSSATIAWTFQQSEEIKVQFVSAAGRWAQKPDL